MPRCNSWLPKTKAPDNVPPRGWRMCRNRVDQSGQRCEPCWTALATHPFWPARESLARELAHRDVSVEDPAIIGETWDRLVNDADVEVRQALIGPATPPHVLAMLATDESVTVAAIAQRHLTGQMAPSF